MARDKVESKLNKRSDARQSKTNVGKPSGRFTEVLQNQWVDRLAFYLLLPLLLLSPFFRGLFFDEELVIAHMYTALIAGIYFLLNHRKVRFPKNIMDYAGAGLILAYIFSSFLAFNLRDGAGEVLKVLNYFLVYWLVARTATNLADMKKVMGTLFLAGVGVAFAGIGTAFGTFSFNGGFVNGLINSTIQYHNAVAIYLIAAGMLGLYLAIGLKNIWARVLVASGTYIAFLTAFGAGSRGAMLVAPVALLIQFLGLPRKEKEKFFYNLLAILIPFTLTAKSVLTFGAKSEGFYWGMLLLGLFIACLTQYGLERFILLGQVQKRSYLTAAGVVVGIALLAILVFKGQDVMPTSIVDRAKSIDLKDASVVERFYFYEDALKVVKDYPMGVGGGGWNASYRAYQSYLYHTTEVHSHPIQVWVEGGTIGFVFFILLWLGLLMTALKVLLRANSPELKALSWSAFATAVALGMHSAIDFTLSLGAPMIFLWAMYGLVRSADLQSFSQDENQFFKPIMGSVYRKIVGVVLAVSLFSVSASFYYAHNKYMAAINSYRYGNAQTAISEMESAVKFNPVNFRYSMDLSQMLLEQAGRTQNSLMVYRAVTAAEDTVRKNKGDAEPLWLLAQAYLNYGKSEQAVETAEKAINRASFRIEGYESLAIVYNAVAQGYLQSGNQDQARLLAEKVLQIPERMRLQDAKVNEDGRSLFKGTRLNQVTQRLQEQIDNASKLLSSIP